MGSDLYMMAPEYNRVQAIRGRTLVEKIREDSKTNPALKRWTQEPEVAKLLAEMENNEP